MIECSKVNGLASSYQSLLSLARSYGWDVSRLPGTRPSYVNEEIGYCFVQSECAVYSVVLYCPPFPVPRPCRFEVLVKKRSIKDVDAELLQMLRSVLSALKQVRSPQQVKRALETVKKPRDLLYIISKYERELIEAYPKLPKLTGFDAELAVRCPGSLASLYMSFLDNLKRARQLYLSALG